MQIWQYNVCHINITVLKDVIKSAERGRKNQGPLAEKVVDKTEITKVLRAINMDSKYR